LLTSFNTTVCVGSSAGLCIDIHRAKSFQYNCLCRFETHPRRSSLSRTHVSIQLFVSVRVNYGKKTIRGFTSFNTTVCVGSSRGENAPSNAARVSIQLFVSVRATPVPNVSLFALGFQYNCLCRFENRL